MRKLIAILLLSTCAAAGADFSGIWIGQIPGRNNESQEVAFKFVQTGSTLGGKLYGDYQSAPITEGKIAGDLVIFIVQIPEQAGNQINDTRLRFSGRMTSGEIELTRDRESATNSGNGGSAPSKTNVKQIFRLKKLL